MKRITSAAILVFLLALLPLQASAAELLIPVGKIVGLQLKSDTVTIADFDDTCGKQSKAAGLRVGDEILQINETNITSAEDVRKAISQCKGDLQVKLRRGSKYLTVNLKPGATENGPRLGVYLRQGISGIGTVTWFNPTDGTFGTLGHGVNLPNGEPLKMASGNAYNAEIISITKGRSGEPGQLKGSASDEAPCGTLFRNTPQGLFGSTHQGWQGEPVPVAQWSELSAGPAVILSTVSGTTPQEYSVEILKIYPANRSNGRNMLIKVTDPALLEATGGIVQGMSGSPILQNGRLVGAVTHVLVNDPTMGYGIFIQNMLDAAA